MAYWLLVQLALNGIVTGCLYAILATGRPAEIQANADVIKAYLGV